MPADTQSTAKSVQIRSILLATDFSPACEKPLRHAVAIAGHFHAKLYLMHVVSSLGLTLVGPDAVAAAVELARDEARRVEQKLATNDAISRIDCHVIVCEGDIWEEMGSIIEQEHIDLVVVGTHSRKGLSKLVLGSVAEQIFRHASCLVLTVGPKSPEEAGMKVTDAVRPLLFATDFGEGSRRALPYAFSLAAQRRTKLVLLHILSPVLKIMGFHSRTPADIAKIQTDEKTAALARLGEWNRLAAAYPVESELMAEFGEPVEGILQTANKIGAEAIIMGLQRQTHVKMVAHLPWSIPYDVVCNAGCPVLTIRS